MKESQFALGDTKIFIQRRIIFQNSSALFVVNKYDDSHTLIPLMSQSMQKDIKINGVFIFIGINNVFMTGESVNSIKNYCTSQINHKTTWLQILHFVPKAHLLQNISPSKIQPTTGLECSTWQSFNSIGQVSGGAAAIAGINFMRNLYREFCYVEQ